MTKTDKAKPMIFGNLYTHKRSVALAACMLVIAGCAEHEVNTWGEWCEQLTGVDLERRYNKWGLFFSVSFDKKGIREDFVDQFNTMISSEVGQQYFEVQDPSDPVIQEMLDLKMIGVWHERSLLHWANSHLRLELHPRKEFDDLVKSIKTHLQVYRNNTSLASLDRNQKADICLWGTIDGVFNELILHGPEEMKSVIPLRHTLNGE